MSTYASNVPLLFDFLIGLQFTNALFTKRECKFSQREFVIISQISHLSLFVLW